MVRLLTAVLACCVATPIALSAQGKVPKRPKLGSGVDTNDARAYFTHGMKEIENNPDVAANAFYWASRIDPGYAEAFYARRVAGFLADEPLLVRWFEGARGIYGSKDVQQLDSLEYRAQMLNPFFLRDLNRTFIAGYLIASVNHERRRAGAPPLTSSERTEVDYLIEGYLRTGTSMRLRGALAAAGRRFPEALDLYGRALKEAQYKVGILVERSHVFFLVGMEDSALADLRQALEELRKAEKDRLIPVYQSKEFFEHSMGVIYERQGNLDAAREAYGRALQENLSYYPGHLRIGMLALAAGDTATAVSELDLATQVATKEATTLVTYGALLARMGRLADAEALLRQAVALEPYYALPHLALGQVAEMNRNRDKAVAAYRDFLARASQRDQRRPIVEQKLADLAN